MIPHQDQRETTRLQKHSRFFHESKNRCKTFGADDATPGVKSDERHQIYTTSDSNTGALSITDFIGGNCGQMLTIVSSNPGANKNTIINGGNLKLKNNWIDGGNKTLTLINCGRQTWREIGSV